MVTSVLGGGSAGAVARATPVPDGTYSFTAKITFGQVHACSGALIERSWVVTAKNCFAEGSTPVVAGPPTRPTTVVVGRTDLTEATGYEASAVSIIPHPDRNLALVQLPVPVSEVPTIPIATVPAAPETLKIAGYGRTATEWVPNQLHAASFTVQDVEPSLIDVVGAADGATICKGDAGGPAFRENDGNAQLVAINNTSWQKGCLGENATQDGATGTRVDDLTDWILWNTCNAPGWTSTDSPQPMEGDQRVGNSGSAQNLALSDYDADGRSDLALYRSSPADGSAWWIQSGATGNQIRSGHRYGGCTDIPVPGDYDGDGTTDLALFRRDCTNGSTWWIQSGAT
ncbi:trypsin-like serine protease, partial [Salinispora fenicalii]|uniref:trypsin-like serine protease n=1 Tax=Salinispora fenicalii TaxID=1137263 RepID=UPI0012BCAEB0